VDKQWVSQKPQSATAIHQLRDTKLTHAMQGCPVGEMPEVPKNVENGLQTAVLRGTDATMALTNAQDAANKQIADYNEKLGG
jgi:sn-glycerol 3-phosphate transport system substrate-binding protein